MEIEGMATLHQLSDSALTVKDRAEDIRGRKVLDKSGKDVGSIDDLMIDDRDLKVRFLAVASGGFLGMGQTKFLIPIDAVTKVARDAVYIDQTRKHVADGPSYAPELATDRDHLGGLYGYYGYQPYWAKGYRYPGFPGLTPWDTTDLCLII